MLSGAGEHCCAGLVLSELSQRSATEGIAHSRAWHAAFDQVQLRRAAVIAMLRGAGVGGGCELAAAAHIRVAESSAFFGLPEEQRGLFVGGCGSPRIPQLIGQSRMAGMMLTERVRGADEAQEVGLTPYRVANGEGLEKAFGLQRHVASNAPLSNSFVLHALPRVACMSPGDGLFAGSLMAAIAQGDDAAKQRLRAYLDGSAMKTAKEAA